MSIFYKKCESFLLKLYIFVKWLYFRTVFEKAVVQKLLDICPKMCNIICIMDKSYLSINCKPLFGGFFCLKGFGLGTNRSDCFF